jgi:hypothetical protein
MILGVIAIFMVSSYNVQASEINIYKCVRPNGRVIFQDSACAATDVMEMHRVEINQSADIDIGLRAYELVVLSRIFQKQL